MGIRTLIYKALVCNGLIIIIFAMRLSHKGNEKMFLGDRLDKVSEREKLEFPYNCIGLIRFKDNSNGSYIGTGFLIASDLVLTVAHNIFSRSSQLPHKDITFFPGINGPEETYEFPYGLKVKSYRFCEEYKT